MGQQFISYKTNMKREKTLNIFFFGTIQVFPISTIFHTFPLILEIRITTTGIYIDLEEFQLIYNALICIFFLGKKLFAIISFSYWQWFNRYQGSSFFTSPFGGKSDLKKNGRMSFKIFVKGFTSSLPVLK